MKKILIFFGVIIVLGGIWYVWTKDSVKPEATPTPSPSPVVSIAPSTSSGQATPTPTPKPKLIKTPTPTPVSTSSPLPPVATPSVFTPAITSVTAYQKVSEPNPGWWISINGTLANGCENIDSPYFWQDGNTFMITLPGHVSGEMCTQIFRTFTQSLHLTNLTLAPGLYTVNINGKNWTSFIIESPSPTPVY